MVTRRIAGALVPFAFACATAPPGTVTDPSGVSENAPAFNTIGAPFAAPPEPLPSRAREVWTLAADPRFLISERPELYATALMIQPARRPRVELLAVLDAWLNDESFLGQSSIKTLPCANGAVCVAVAPQDPGRLIQRVRSGVLADRDGLALATTRARAQITSELEYPNQIAAFILSASPSFERPGPGFFDSMGAAELGESLQAILESSSICLVVPSSASFRGTPWPGPLTSETPSQGVNPKVPSEPEVLLVPQANEGTPLLAWAARPQNPEASPADEDLSAEVILARLGEQGGPVMWNRFTRQAGAFRRVEVENLVDAVTQLRSALLPSNPASASATTDADGALHALARSTIALHRLDFGACERSERSGIPDTSQIDIVVVGASSLAPTLEAAGLSVRVVAAPR